MLFLCVLLYQSESLFCLAVKYWALVYGRTSVAETNIIKLRRDEKKNDKGYLASSQGKLDYGMSVIVLWNLLNCSYKAPVVSFERTVSDWG